MLITSSGEIASDIAERIRYAVEQRGIPHIPDVGPVTVGIGVAAQIPDTDPFEVLIRAADTALYKAKRTGRNRVGTGDALLRGSGWSVPRPVEAWGR